MQNEQIGKCLAEIESLEKQINSLPKQLEDINKILSQKYPVLEQLKNEREKLRKNIKAIGFFKFKERKPLKEDIAVNTAKIRKSEEEVTEQKNKINMLKQQEIELNKKLQTVQQKKDELEKEEIEIKKAEQGDPEAQYNLGIRLMGKNNFSEAKQWFKKSFEQGNSAALWKYQLCDKKENGAGHLYISEYITRASQGNRLDQYLVGCAYLKGYLTIEGKTLVLEEGPDIKKAIEWLKKADGQGSEFAKIQLADCYLYGWGIGKNENLGLSMLTETIKDGRTVDAQTDAQESLKRYQNKAVRRLWWEVI
jgi:DNA repair exonuclease SbcCD ATPase subunit